MPTNKVKEIVRDFGSQRALAEFLVVTPQAITLWIKGAAFPPSRAIDLERWTKGKYKAVDIAPPSAKTKSPKMPGPGPMYSQAEIAGRWAARNEKGNKGRNA